MNIIAIIDHELYSDNYLDIAHSLDGLVPYIWYRIKNLSSKEIYYNAKQMRLNIKKSKLLLSADSVIADILHFDGVQLNSSSIYSSDVRVLFPNLEIGYSAHSIDEIAMTDADIFTLSPIYKTKLYEQIDTLGDIVVDNIDKNIYALGGVQLVDYNKLTRAGFFGIAGISLIEELIK